MTREFLQKYWREIEVFKDGKEIEWKFLTQCAWHRLTDLNNLDEALHELRIKPQLFTLYCRLYKDGSYSYPDTDKERVLPEGPPSESRIIKLVEVPE